MKTIKIIAGIDLTVGLLSLFMALSGKLHGSDENLTLVGIGWGVGYISLALSLFYFDKVSKLLPLITWLLIPTIIFFTIILMYMQASYYTSSALISIRHVIGLILITSGLGLMWILWIFNLAAVNKALKS